MKTSIKVNSAIVCGVNKDFSILYIRDTDTLIIGLRKDYDNHGNFYGVPVVTVRPKDHKNVRPGKLFNMLGGNHSFTNALTGITDWESRAEWLAYFTPEEKQKAVEIESYIDFVASYDPAAL